MKKLILKAGFDFVGTAAVVAWLFWCANKVY